MDDHTTDSQRLIGIAIEEGGSLGCERIGDGSSDSLDEEYIPHDDEFATSDDASCDVILEEDDNDISIEDTELNINLNIPPPLSIGSGRESGHNLKMCMGYSFTVDSDYEDSDDLNDVVDDSDEELEDVAKFNPKTDMEDPKFVLGMVFQSFQILKTALRTYSIKNRFPLVINKNDKTRVRARCADSCPWKLYAAHYKGGEKVQIRTLVDEHTCVKGFSNKFATYIWIAEAYYDLIRLEPNISTETLKQLVQRDYKVFVHKSKAGRAKRYALNLLRGDEKEQYMKLADYGGELRTTNPGSTLILSLDNLIFKKLFVCISACKQGFLSGCRPIISLDGCHLKGRYDGILLAAVGIDPNDCIWPIAYAIVDVECRESWSWFLELLGIELGIENSQSWTFMSDRQKGLIQAVRTLFPNSEHRHCVRHLVQNFKKSFSGEALKNTIWEAARSTYEGEFRRHMVRLRDLSPDGWAWMNNIPPAQWSRAHFREQSKCDILLNNMSECFNNFISDARDKPILTVLEMIRTKLMVRIANKRKTMLRWNSNVCPKIAKKLEKSKDMANHCWVLPAGLREFQVNEREGQFSVDLGSQTCSCRKWQLTRLPCAHACAALTHNGNVVEDVIDSCYTVDTFQRVYGNIIHPVRSANQWEDMKHDPIKPPQEAPPRPGRPKKKKRRREVGEDAPISRRGRIGRIGMVMHCRRCGGAGHNMRSCNNPPCSTRSQGSTSTGDNSQISHDANHSRTGRGRPNATTNQGRRTGSLRNRGRWL